MPKFEKAAAALVCAMCWLAMVSCDQGSGVGDGPPPQASEPGSTSVEDQPTAGSNPSEDDDPSGETSSGEAEAGESGPPSTNNEVVLTGGALGAPRAPTGTATRTPQFYADEIYERGLIFENGLEHHPQYVECESSAYEAGAVDCYVQVEGVQPYIITARSDDSGEMSFDFRQYVS